MPAAAAGGVNVAVGRKATVTAVRLRLCVFEVVAELLF